MRIIVVGAGVGGLTTAIALRKVGIDAQIYERAPALREVGSGIGLAANALSALDLLGLGDCIRSQSVAAIQGGLKNPKGDELVAISRDELSQLDIVAVMHRAELLASLVQHVDRERLHLNRTCVGIEQDGDGVTARFDNGETAHADGLIGADGLRSVVRARLFDDERRIRYSGYTVWRSVIEFSGNLTVSETWGRGRRFGIVPMSRGRVYWFAVKNAPEGERDPEGRTKEMLLRLFRGWHEPIEAFIAAAQEDSILRNDIYDMNPLPNWVRGRAGLLGDAAHAMTPNLGQGACQAMEDAVVLAACLKKNGRVESALLEYERRRRPRARQVVLESRRLGAIAQCGNPFLCWVRDAALRMTPKKMAARQLKSLLAFEILTPAERDLFH